VFYSFRHTYATLALTHDKVPIHTLAKQMGTSVKMIEQHYGHLSPAQKADVIAGKRMGNKKKTGNEVKEEQPKLELVK
jgi:integrase